MGQEVWSCRKGALILATTMPSWHVALPSLVMASITSEKHQAGLAWLNVRKVSAFLVCKVTICDVDLDAVVCSPGATRTHTLALPSNECMSGQEAKGSCRARTAYDFAQHTSGAFSAVTTSWYSPGLARRVAFCSTAVPPIAAAWV
jgi:hypothetical protein